LVQNFEAPANLKAALQKPTNQKFEFATHMHNKRHEHIHEHNFCFFQCHYDFLYCTIFCR